VENPQSTGKAEIIFLKPLKRQHAKLIKRTDSKTVMAKLKD
jgi:hypothetical protein